MSTIRINKACMQSVKIKFCKEQKEKAIVSLNNVNDQRVCEMLNEITIVGTLNLNFE